MKVNLDLKPQEPKRRNENVTENVTESQLIELRKRVEYLHDVSALADIVEQSLLRASRNVFLEPPGFLMESESKVVARLRRSIMGLLADAEFQTSKCLAEEYYALSLQEYFDAKAAFKAEVRP